MRRGILGKLDTGKHKCAHLTEKPLPHYFGKCKTVIFTFIQKIKVGFFLETLYIIVRACVCVCLICLFFYFLYSLLLADK